MKKLIPVIIVMALVIMQFFPIKRIVGPVKPGASIMDDASVPDDIKTSLKAACFDCHSNQPAYPWYASIAPISWWLAGHIEEGRSDLNFSEWSQLSAEQKAHKKREMCVEIEATRMPLTPYKILHSEARLSDAQVKAICDWSKQ